MDIRKYDEAFVTKIGAVSVPGRGYYVEVVGITNDAGAQVPVPVMFDLSEEWWEDRDKYGVDFDGERQLVGVNVKRVDIIPDPSRFLPNFKARELSDNPDYPNTWNIQKIQPKPVTILYDVQMVSESQYHMNQLLQHMMVALPSQGFGTTLTVDNRVTPFRAQSVHSETKESTGKRKFVHQYTYAVEGWVTSTECVKIKQILSVHVTFEDYDEKTFEETVIIDENGVQ